MDTSFPGLGTVINTVGVALGAGVGMAAGRHLPERTRTIVTDCLGLVTLLMAGLSASSVTDPALIAAVGSAAPALLVLGALLIGGIIGSSLRIEERLESLVSRARARFAGPAGESASSARERFIEGWLTSTLLFCVGPLTILGSINDGLGRGIDQLVLKTALDTFAAMAFASTFGVGVMFSALSVLVVQGLLTVAGMMLGAFMTEAEVMALTATGGLMLVGISFRLLSIRQIRVGDLLPALVLAPVFTAVVTAFR